MSSETVITVDSIGKTFRMYKRPQDRLLERIFPKRRYAREFHALSDISFSINRGETVGIIGRNGSGKSTLLQMICGTLTPTLGQITVNGRVAALLELGAGFNPEFTGRENVYMNGAILGLSRQEIDRRLDDIFAFAEIGEFVDQPVKTYSSGMYVRLAFAVIAHVDADILVIDEALSVGDALFTQKCMRFLRKFRETGTILFVSHDSAAVTNLCQRAIWLHQGRIQEQGDAKSVCESYLAMLFNSKNTAATNSDAEHTVQATANHHDWVDMRRDFINGSTLRNDLEVFHFDADTTGFGNRGATIQDVTFRNDEDQPLHWVVGGEVANIAVTVVANQDLYKPIVGFYIKDKLGQTLFGDNTYLTYADEPRPVAVGETVTARFRFPLPYLPIGDYSIAVAVADGTQEEHVQHHWIHDAVLFRSHSSAVATGLVGIPMLDIRLEDTAP